jgi:putative hydrolase of the HAD superfamily
MKRKYNHIFFDLDHTLWDFERNSGATLKVLFDDFDLAGYGISSFELFRSTYEAHNEKFWERFRKGFIRRDELRWKRMWHTLLDFKIADNDLAHRMSSIYLELLPQQGKLMPYAIEILDYCAEQDYKVHLITNGFETTQWQKMRTSGIDRYFGEVITSERSNSMKPHAAIFDYALNATGAALAESIMIGDALEADIAGAQNYGMDQVYFNPGGLPHDQKPTYEIDCLSKLKDLL